MEPVDGQPVADAEPGQYIGLRLAVDEAIVHRHYSLSGSPNGRSYRISVKQEPGGLVSNFLHQQMRVGDTLELLPPAGELTLEVLRYTRSRKLICLESVLCAHHI